MIIATVSNSQVEIKNRKCFFILSRNNSLLYYSCLMILILNTHWADNHTCTTTSANYGNPYFAGSKFQEHT